MGRYDELRNENMNSIILTSLIAATLLEFQALPVSKFAPAEAVFNAVEKKITFKANQTDAKESWRLIHNGINVIDLFRSKGFTTTIYTIFEADSAQKCLDEIKRLNLIDNRKFKEENLRNNQLIQEGNHK